MEWYDTLFLSRLQFALTVMFHYLYPPLSIGLGVLLVFMEGMYLKTGDKTYERMTKFWVKVFGLTFGIGVATGIVLEFEFGTNWSTYSRFVGDVFGSALAAEGIFAFFLESGFLAILLFGWNKVSKKMHFFATCMVSLGSMFSAVWIVIANSWQQTPAGHHIVGEGDMARAEILDFWAMVFNPSSMTRLGHVLGGAWLLGAFVVMSICAWYILKGRHLDFARKCFKIALVLATFSALLQLALGHRHANIVAEHQPAKLAAFEGIYETTEKTPLWLFGFPDSDAGRVKYGLAVPGGLNLLVNKEFQPIKGLDQFAPEDRPPVMIPFQTYHIMIACGMYFIGLTLFACFLWWRGTLFEKRWLMWVFVFSVVLPYIANQAGWVAAEVGRQPWIVYGLLRTADGVSKVVSPGEVLGSLTMFMIIYLLLFVLFIYMLDRKIKAGPEEPEDDETGEGEGFFETAAERGPGKESI